MVRISDILFHFSYLVDLSRRKLVLEMMSVPDLTQDQVTYRQQKIRVQKQPPHVQPATSMNFKEGYHSNVLNSTDFSINFDKPPRGVYIPQPLTVPPSPNDYSLN
ncbi:Trans-acting T-cell-specific transcription factor GATA-3 [Datura stramonium]|uniref:Trans-acting T-cell-specific transcription factor GATA-3 n=1 Tax=Datura stramonium TaxID=4076 RepID=A0ABS8UL61_DATST|nr:Trans-acting T-cell-specific transcription factor GATA-3 [Datura stramonium]